MNFIPDFSLYLLLFVAGTFLTLGDLSMKQLIKVGNGSFLAHPFVYLIGIFAYIIGTTLFAFSLRKENIAVATIILIFFNILTVLAIGRYFYGENFSSWQYVGIILGLLSIISFELAG